MTLTPDDIVNYELKQSMRGYSVSQVDELLDRVADQLERLYRELEDTRRRLDRAERRAESVSETETTLKRTLVTAQRAAEQTLEEARSRAADVVADAEEEADRIRTAATQGLRGEVAELTIERDRLEEQVETLRRFESDYRTQFKELLDRYRRLLDAEATVEPDDPPRLEQEPELRDEFDSGSWEEVWPDESWSESDVWRALADDDEIGVDVLDALRRSGAPEEFGTAADADDAEIAAADADNADIAADDAADADDAHDADDADIAADDWLRGAPARGTEPDREHAAADGPDADVPEGGGEAGPGDEDWIGELAGQGHARTFVDLSEEGPEEGAVDERRGSPVRGAWESDDEEPPVTSDTVDESRTDDESERDRGHPIFEAGARRRRRR